MWKCKTCSRENVIENTLEITSYLSCSLCRTSYAGRDISFFYRDELTFPSMRTNSATQQYLQNVQMGPSRDLLPGSNGIPFHTIDPFIWVQSKKKWFSLKDFRGLQDDLIRPFIQLLKCKEMTREAFYRTSICCLAEGKLLDPVILWYYYHCIPVELHFNHKEWEELVLQFHQVDKVQLFKFFEVVDTFLQNGCDHFKNLDLILSYAFEIV